VCSFRQVSDLLWASVSCLYLFYFFGETGFWIQGFTLAKQVFFCLSHAVSSFCFGYFGDGSCELFAQAGLEPWPSWSQLPKYLGIQTRTTKAWPTCMFLRQILLCNPGWSWTFDLAATASSVLGFQICTTMPNFWVVVLTIQWKLTIPQPIARKAEQSETQHCVKSPYLGMDLGYPKTLASRGRPSFFLLQRLCCPAARFLCLFSPT
jgi:hypothetical protein